MRVRVFDRGVLIGATIGAVAGIAWSLWAASGLAHVSVIAGLIVGVVGVVVGLLVLVPTARGRRSTPARQRSSPMLSSGRYWLVVVAEFAAIIAGTVLLSGTGYSA